MFGTPWRTRLGSYGQPPNMLGTSPSMAGTLWAATNNSWDTQARTAGTPWAATRILNP